MGKFLKIVKGFILAAMLLATIFIVFTSLNLFGLQMFVVKSGSMEPKIHTGSVVIDHKTGNYGVSDVITFRVSGSTDTVTHRVVAVKEDSAGTTYQVKGDANNSPDPDAVPKANVVGKVKFSIPLVGYLVAFIKTLPGLILFVIIPATIIIYQELTNIKEEIKKIKAAEKEVAREEKRFVAWWKKQLARLKKWMENNRKEAASKGETDGQDR